MATGNNQPNPKKGWIAYFLKFVHNVKSLQHHEWVTIIVLSLFGFFIFLLGYIVQIKHTFIGHAIMTFATIVTLESIAWSFNHFIIRYKIAGEIDYKFELLKKDVIQELNSFIGNAMDELGESIAKRLAGTKHIVEAGIVNVLQEFDLKRVLRKCSSTTLFLQRFYFSPKEFQLLEGAIVDLIVKDNCRIQIILSAPDQSEIIEDKVKSCQQYETSIAFSVVQISLYITKQIKQLKKIAEDLPADKKDYLQVKIYRGNMSASITGHNDIIFSGVYLNNDIAEEGFQEKNEGKYTKAYQVWQHYFLNNWRNAEAI